MTNYSDLEDEKTRDLLNYAYRNCSVPFYKFLVLFSQNLQHIDVLRVIARILLMLSGDAAMSSVAPFKSHELLLLMCDHASVGLYREKLKE